MNIWIFLLAYFFIPLIALPQPPTDTAVHFLNTNDQYKPASKYGLMIFTGTGFYTTEDTKINSFLAKYGYLPSQEVPIGIQLGIALMPYDDKMIYAINAATIVSRQSMITADFSLSAYRHIIQKRKWWITAGLAFGEHFDRIVLNGRLPASFDSLATRYASTLSLHRTGFIMEPGGKIYWYPLKTKKLQLGLFAGIVCDLDINSRWHLGFYPENSSRFRRIKEQTGVGSTHEIGWLFPGGISVCF
jgi:hypothetical protein